MAISTTDLYVRPEDGWTLVATAPSRLMIKPEDYHAWWVAVASSTPDDALIGIPMGRNSDNRHEPFVLPEGTTGNVYIRTRTPIAVQPATQHTRFAVYAETT